MKTTRLSIITVNLNNREGLRRTIESVVSQTWQDFEYLIIDGASADGSVEVIQEYPRINYSVSEPDTGIYNAMNKGIARASGEYCLFMNSGDIFLTNEILADISRQDWAADIIYADYYATQDGQTLKWETFPEPTKLTLNYFITRSLPHPATLIKKSLFSQHGLYDESFTIVADWVFFIRCVILGHCTLARYAKPIVIFDTNGISNRLDRREQIQQEKKRALQTFFPRIYPDYSDLSLLLDAWNTKGVRTLYRFKLFVIRFFNWWKGP